MGLDVDAYKEGRRETMLAIVDRHGSLPPTWISTSRGDSSGIRLYRLPFNAERGDLKENIEHPGDGPSAGEVLQHGHRYTMVWPSIHPEGREYQWTDKATGETGRIPRPAELPELPPNGWTTSAVNAPASGSTGTKSAWNRRKTP